MRKMFGEGKYLVEWGEKEQRRKSFGEGKVMTDVQTLEDSTFSLEGVEWKVSLRCSLSVILIIIEMPLWDCLTPETLIFNQNVYWLLPLPSIKLIKHFKKFRFWNEWRHLLAVYALAHVHPHVYQSMRVLSMQWHKNSYILYLDGKLMQFCYLP